MKVEFKHILCATDLSEFSNYAVFYGAAVAREFGARLHLCHVVDFPSVSVRGAEYAFPLDQQENLIERADEKLKALMSGRSAEWETLVTTGSPADTISSLVKEKNIDLAISATHARTGLKRFLLGSVTERLIRSISCPLLIVRPPERELDAGEIRALSFKRILVGCDFSSDSENALNYAFSLAQEFEAQIHIVHVIEPFTYRDMLLPDTVVDVVKEDLQSRLIDKLTNLIPAEAHHWCDIKTLCLGGEPFEELVRYAHQNEIDLITLGVRGRGLVETLLLGSTTDRVIRRASCPVLSVHPPDSKK
ncbi:MAG: universal stress protein [Desulfobacterales bacterium]|nr:universal stress protein [Desulfobacterales bacterium]